MSSFKINLTLFGEVPQRSAGARGMHQAVSHNTYPGVAEVPARNMTGESEHERAYHPAIRVLMLANRYRLASSSDYRG
jgi:hypothetical protein